MGLIQSLFTNPVFFLQYTLFRVPALLIALCCHEWAHAWVANRCGDPTARILGRMTLNPLRHLDPIGTLLMFTAGFGWAKGVPVNPDNYRNRRWDDLKVSLAGITVNFMLFLFFMAIAVAINRFVWTPWLLTQATPQDLLSFNDGLYNWFLYAPDSITPFIHAPWLLGLLYFIMLTAQINLALAIFNLFPFPPLDGFHVANDILLGGRLRLNSQAVRVGMMVLLFISFSTDIISNIMLFFMRNIQGAL